MKLWAIMASDNANPLTGFMGVTEAVCEQLARANGGICPALKIVPVEGASLDIGGLVYLGDDRRCYMAPALEGVIR